MLLTVALLLGALGATAHAQSSALAIPREPPPGGKVAGFSVTASGAVTIAGRVGKVRALADEGALEAEPFLFGDDYWLVVYRQAGRVRAEVQVNGRDGRVAAAAVDRELAWPKLWQGSHGPHAQRVNTMLIVLGALFLLPFVSLRRLRRRTHLELLALLSLGLSYVFAQRGDVSVATPLFYPSLLLLLVMLVLVALRPAAPRRDGLTWMSPRALVIGLGGLLALRYGFNLIDGEISDIGYASVYGADSILNGFDVYNSSVGSGELDVYGPLNYVAYVPFVLAFPFDLSNASADAAVAAAITFDALTVAGLWLLGRRIHGNVLGLALAWGYAAFPFTFLALAANTNDGLVAALLVWLLVFVSSPWARGLLFAAVAATKFAPAVLGMLFLRSDNGRALRPALVYLGAAALLTLLLLAAYLPDGGIGELYDATVGYQLSRSSPFSVWGLYESVEPLRPVVTAAGVLFAAAAVVVPRRRTVATLAAMGGALLIAAQLSAIHWYWYYIPWFLPYALVAFFSRSYAGSVRNSGSSSPSAVSSNSS